MKSQKLFSLLGVGIIFLGVIFFVFLLSIAFLITKKEDVDYNEESITSRYITSSTPVLDAKQDSEITQVDTNFEKQGVLKVQENRKVIKIENPLSEKEKLNLEKKYSITFTDDKENNGIYVVTLSEDTDISSFEQEIQAKVETDIPIKMFADSIDWGVTRIGADKVWSQGTGTGVKIGIVDTGVQLNHPDLVNNIVAGYDFVNNDTDASDDNGHGTHVAGLASASFNEVGVVGVSHSSKIIPIKVLNAQGYGYLSDVAKGVYFATDNGAKVINLSLGSSTDSLILKDAINYAANKGVLVIAAAGNDSGSPCSYPAAYSNAVCVVATDSRNLLASFSNIGGELAAPGVYNYSTYLGSTYRYLSGTSMATPHVSGAAALLFSICTTCSASDIRTLMNETAIDLGEVGKDILFGYGLVDLTSAIVQLQSVPQENTPTETPTQTPDTQTPTTTEPDIIESPEKQVIMILEPVASRGKKYIPSIVSDIDIKYTLSPVIQEDNVEKITMYVDNTEIASSLEQSGTFVLSKDLLNHSQHWVKLVATFKDNKNSQTQLIVDMTYLRSLEKKSNAKDKSVLGISFSIFDWLDIFNK